MEESYNEIINNLDKLSFDQLAELAGKSLFALNKSLNNDHDFCSANKRVSGTISDTEVDIAVTDDDYYNQFGPVNSYKLGYWEY